LAKIIAHGADRATAIQRLERALQTAVLLGFTHNLAYLHTIVQQPDFATGQVNTHFLADQLANWLPPAGDRHLALIGAALAQFYAWPQLPENSGYWRNNPNGPLCCQFLLGNETWSVLLEPVRFQSDQFNITLRDERFLVVCAPQDSLDWNLVVNGRSHKLIILPNGDDWWVQTESGVICATALPRLPGKTAVSATAGSLRAPMPGSILAVLVSSGQQVTAGEPLLKLEAMKMEHTIRAPAEGTVAEIFYAPGDSVMADAQLLCLTFPD
jgi:acetyl/propionyl-CoA carboxylase alpha subunit